MPVIESIAAQFWSSLFNGLTLGSTYALIALGLSMVYGILGLINFAHGDVFTVGSFASVGVILFFGVGSGLPPIALVLVLVLAGAAGMAASGVAAVGLELAAYRPLRLRGAPRHAAMISGLGASLFIQELLALQFGRNIISYPEILPTTSVLSIGDGVVTNKMVLILAATAITMVALERFVESSRWGRAMRALAQEPKAAALMGVDASRIILLTFLIGGLCAGLGGFLYSIYFSKTIYSLGFIPGIKGLTAAILGGVGNLRGAVVGGLALGLLQSYGSIFISSQLTDVIAFGTLILVLLFRPRGLLGERMPRR